MAFVNLVQATAEDRTAVTNLMTANSTLREQVAMYANRLSTKEADNMELQTAIRSFQGELKNLKAKIYSLKKSVHSGAAGAANKETGILVPK